MRILTRYVLREFSKVFGLCLAGLLGIYYIVDMFNHIEIFITYDAPLVYKFAYFLYKLPLIVYQVAPVALLIAVVVVIGIMSRHNEITAVKAGGVNLYALTLPLVSAALLVSLLIFVNNEYLLPSTNQKAADVLNVRIKGKPPRGLFRQSRIWYAGKENTFYNVAILDPKGGHLEGVTLYRFDDSFHPLERLDARRARPSPGGWVFEDVIRRRFADDGSRLAQVQRLDRLALDLPETLEDFGKYKKDPDEMNYRELSRYVARLETSGFNATPYQVDLMAKTSMPFISLVVAFLSIALALGSTNRGGIVAAIGLCMATGLAYWLVLSMGLSLGHAGRLNPFMASWGANLLFGSAGVWFYAKLRQ